MERKDIEQPLTAEGAFQYSTELKTAVFRDAQNKEFMIDQHRGAGIGAKYGYYIKDDERTYISHSVLVELLNGETIDGVTLIKR